MVLRESWEGLGRQGGARMDWEKWEGREDWVSG